MDKQLEEMQKTWQGLYDTLTKGQLFNLLMESIEQKIKSKGALKEIESLTRNPREYQPSYYTLNHIARNALKDS